MHMRSSSQTRVNLSDPEFRLDPWSAYARVRERGPVVPAKMTLIGKCWAATTYETVNETLKRSDVFVRDPKAAGRTTFIPFQWILPRSIMALTRNMISVDGEDHRRLRALVEEAFTRRNIEGMSGRIEFLANETLDDIERRFEVDGQVDLVETYARQLPLSFICELLGLPVEGRGQFKRWLSPMSSFTNALGLFRLMLGVRPLIRYLREQFEIVRNDPRPGLMTELVQAECEGDRLDKDELLSMVFVLLVAGFETTVHLISNGLLILFRLPEVRARLMDDWSLGDAFIEETLRYSSPLQMAKPRFVAHDMEFHGQSLKQGEMIVPLIAAANYDPQRFPNPAEFDLDRPQNYHMSFGSGPHTCLGIKLARLETNLALRCLLERWPTMQPAFNLDQPDWAMRLGTRGLRTLMVELGRSAAGS